MFWTEYIRYLAADMQMAAARATDITKPNFPLITLNPTNLSNKDFRMTSFHELLHMGGSHGHPHIHDYNNPAAPDLAQACAACCFGDSLQVSSSESTAMRLGIANGQELKNLNCKICAGHFPRLSDQQVAYAKSELAQGNPTSFRLAIFELRKAVTNDPQNQEAWRLMAYALATLSPPRNIDTDFKALAAYEKAIALDPTQPSPLRNDPNYKRIKSLVSRSNMTHGQTMWEYRGYTGVQEGAPGNKAFQNKIIALETNRAGLRMALQGCHDFSVGNPCRQQLDQAIVAYRDSRRSVLAAEKTGRHLGNRINMLNQEYHRHTNIYNCVIGKDAAPRTPDQCFQQAYQLNSDNQRSDQYRDWVLRP